MWSQSAAAGKPKMKQAFLQGGLTVQEKMKLKAIDVMEEGDGQSLVNKVCFVELKILVKDSTQSDWWVRKKTLKRKLTAQGAMPWRGEGWEWQGSRLGESGKVRRRGRVRVRAPH